AARRVDLPREGDRAGVADERKARRDLGGAGRAGEILELRERDRVRVRPVAPDVAALEGQLRLAVAAVEVEEEAAFDRSGGRLRRGAREGEQGGQSESFHGSSPFTPWMRASMSSATGRCFWNRRLTERMYSGVTPWMRIATSSSARTPV